MIGEGLEVQPAPRGRRRGAARRPHPKECYARAGRYQLAQPDVTLVHAIVNRQGLVFVHAWCELPEGLTYDGADNAFYRSHDYRRHVRPAQEVRYTAQESGERAYESGCWEGWDVDDSALADYLRTEVAPDE